METKTNPSKKRGDQGLLPPMAPPLLQSNVNGHKNSVSQGGWR